MARAEKVAARLTQAQRVALITAFDMSDGSGTYPRLAVRVDVRRRLIEAGLLGRRIGNPLTKLGLEVRLFLVGEQARATLAGPSPAGTS